MAIEACGADVVRVSGTYDDAVVEANRKARENGWIVVSDTSWEGYEQIPSLVMQGYTAMVAEALDVLPTRPTHVFLQAGVGGFAAAASATLEDILGSRRPKIVVVEPERAACLLESAKAGRATAIAATEPTIMAMLECYVPSTIAWRILSNLANAFMTVSEEDGIEAIRSLATPTHQDTAIVAGESGGAGLAGLQRAARVADIRRALDLLPTSNVLLFNTETATDPTSYERHVGSECRP